MRGVWAKKSIKIWQKFVRPTVVFPESKKLFPPMVVILIAAWLHPVVRSAYIVLCPSGLRRGGATGSQT